MKQPILIFFMLSLYAGHVIGQQRFCADSSIRIKYALNYPDGELLVKIDTTGENFFIGSFNQNTNPQRGIPVFKTNWGDSIYWAKKYYNLNENLALFNISSAPGGTLICNGVWGNNSDIFLCRIDTNGNILWSNRYRLTTSHPGYSSGQKNYKNILVTNDAIYYIASLGFYNTVFKLDLDGNIIWSTHFRNSNIQLEGSKIIGSPVINGDTLIVVSSYSKQSPVTLLVNERFPIITKINKTTGALYQSTAYKTFPEPFIKGLFPEYLRINNDNSFSLIGSLSLETGSGLTPGSSYTFNLLLDNLLLPVSNTYYDFDPIIVLDGQRFSFDFNFSNQKIFLYDVLSSNDKYFVTFDNNLKISRTRKFTSLANSANRYYINLDDKENIHFTFNYREYNRFTTEYARLSNLAPENTFNCFGIDTSILQPIPFSIYTEVFNWNIININVLSSYPVNLIEEPEIVNKEVVCKQISYCDSVKILGNPVACIAGGDVRFSSFLNPQCLKNLNWSFDTTYASVVNYEADSALTLRLKQSGQFYLKAEVNNCVVKDSVLVTITKPQTALQWNKQDSLLCPGGTVTLQVNDGFRSYQWQDGSTNSSYIVTSPGLYRITATDSCGTVFTDSVNVTIADTTLAIAANYTICAYDSARILLPPGVYNINWQPVTSGLLQGNTLTLFPQQTTSYLLQAQKTPGCLVEKNITVVKEDCAEWVRFPSAFTPNNDGLNDLFKPGVSGQLQSYNLKIFDRNGQLIFQTNNPFAGWNGRFKSTAQNAGVFVYMATYNFFGNEKQIVKGTITLIR